MSVQANKTNIKGDWRFMLARQVNEPLASVIRRLDDARAAGITEIRLRTGRKITARIQNREQAISDVTVSAVMLAELLAYLCDFSLYAKQEQLAGAYITLPGGFRAGITGSAARLPGGEMTISGVSGINIRVMREINGCAAPVYRRLFGGGLCSVLIISPPGMGKTTLLRDLVRILSDNGTRIAVADERGEIAASFAGTYAMDVGACSDVLDGCAKHLAIPLLLRSMTPDIIAADEIGAMEDAGALREAALSGVEIIATAHAMSLEEAYKREFLQPLLGMFDAFVILGGEPGHVLLVCDKAGEAL